PFGKGSPSPPRTPPHTREKFDWWRGRAAGVPLSRKAVGKGTMGLIFLKVSLFEYFLFSIL
ncbi:hypothetical protein, partial [Bilophila wadsworthia]|uniref:hypothetical protein n=1 Tax=Bilophila wadsworthia TaxID=35833 RepID=UPI0032606329